MRILFMGTANFAVPSLTALAAGGHEILAVLTQPDRPYGRRGQLRPSPVKETAMDLGLPLFQPEKVNRWEIPDSLRSPRPDAVIVVAYGQILRTPLLELGRLGAINLHGSLLPELRGAAPVQWALLRGFTQTGITAMLMDEGLDTGPVLLQSSVEIDSAETAGELAGRLSAMGGELLCRALDGLASGAISPIPQDDQLASHAPPLHRDDGFIAWSAAAPELRGRIHSCNPWPGAYFIHRGQEIKVWRAAALDQEGEPGEILAADPLVVAAGRGSLALIEVQPAGGRRMSGEELARGRRWRRGMLVQEPASQER